MLYGDTSTWNHFVNDGLKPIQDLLLRQECGVEQVSAVFQYISHVSFYQAEFVSVADRF